MEAQAPWLSLVIPAFNEVSRGLQGRLDTVLEFLRATGRDFELIVVDDGSNDGTGEVVRAAAALDDSVRLVSQQPNAGKGAAVRRGLMSSRGQFVAFIDADLATPLAELLRLLEETGSGADVAIASRGLPESNLQVRENPVREASGKFYNVLIQWLLVPGILDTQCGCKAFRGDVARALAPGLSEPRFAFDVELVYLARTAGAVIREVPVTWSHQPGSRLSFLKDGIRMLVSLIRIWLRSRTGSYDVPLERLRRTLASS